jgi:hypothetical protein
MLLLRLLKVDQSMDVFLSIKNWQQVIVTTRLSSQHLLISASQVFMK